VETQGELHQAGSVTLDSNGNGTVTVMPDNARQRWEVRRVVVSTNQSATSTLIPVAEVFVNSTQSRASSRGATWSGNQDILDTNIRVGPCDVLNVVFSPGPGGAAPGVIASAVVEGDRFTRRS
jgi:hypothetical protein